MMEQNQMGGRLYLSFGPWFWILLRLTWTDQTHCSRSLQPTTNRAHVKIPVTNGVASLKMKAAVGLYPAIHSHRSKYPPCAGWELNRPTSLILSICSASALLRSGIVKQQDVRLIVLHRPFVCEKSMSTPRRVSREKFLNSDSCWATMERASDVLFTSPFIEPASVLISSVTNVLATLGNKNNATFSQFPPFCVSKVERGLRHSSALADRRLRLEGCSWSWWVSVFKTKLVLFVTMPCSQFPLTWSRDLCRVTPPMLWSN